MKARPLVVVYNATSGSAVSPRELRKLCTTAGFSVTKLLPIDDRFAQRLSPHLTKDSWIAAVGGDGTISAVASHVANTHAVLVPLPGGTLNHFTKDLGVDQDLAAALKHAFHASPQSIDIASVNDIYFVNNSSIGVYPQSLQTRKRTEDKLGKWPAAAYGLLRAFIIYKTYEITIGNKSLTTPFVFIGNNDYKLDTLSVQGRTSLSGGILSVYAVNSASRFELIRIFARALTRTLHSERELTHLTSPTMTIKSSHHRVRVSHDGEMSKQRFPLEYKIHAKSLRVVAPSADLL